MKVKMMGSGVIDCFACLPAEVQEEEKEEKMNSCLLHSGIA